MKLTVTSASGDVFPVDVPEDMELENFLALAQAEIPGLSQVPVENLTILHNGATLAADPKKSLKDCSVQEGDMVLVGPRNVGSSARGQIQGQGGPGNSAASGGVQNPLAALFDFSQIRIPGQQARSGSGSNNRRGSNGAGTSGPQRFPTVQELLGDPDKVRQLIKERPEILAAIKAQNPQLAAALESEDIGKFQEVLKKQTEHKLQVERMRIRAMNDPFDVEAQAFLENEIRQENIESALDLAMEHTPESFGQVTMLYINCSVNGHHIKAFVDSGAQTTILSSSCAERCNIMRLVDKRFSGVAKGVGTQKIIGRIHSAQLKIEKDYLPVSFTVLEDQSMDMLLGLDMLKRHQCVLDLNKNILHIGTTGSDTPFLPESELPRHARGNAPSDDDDVNMDADLAKAISNSTEEAVKSNGAAAAGDSETLANEETSVKAPEFPAGVSEANVKELEQMGFNRGQVISELEKASGDKNAAVAALIAKSLQMKK